MITITAGSKKKIYKSIREASDATGISYMTLYMRLRAGVPVGKAMKKPVRSYNKKAA